MGFSILLKDTSTMTQQGPGIESLTPITWQPAEPNVRRYGVKVSEDNEMKLGQSFEFVPLSPTLKH